MYCVSFHFDTFKKKEFFLIDVIDELGNFKAKKILTLKR